MSRVTALVMALLIAISVVATTSAVATKVKGPKTYQATGKVLDVTDGFIAIDKGGERWEVGRDSSTTITGDLAVGATVTIQYEMTAHTVTVKPAKTK